ncbi:MAG: hypothetical protein QXL18_02170, partial [Candidatus Woesearchaeota archaeon]
IQAGNNSVRGPPPSTPYRIPIPNAHSQSLYNGIEELNNDEKIIFNYITQITKPQFYTVFDGAPLGESTTKNTTKLEEIITKNTITYYGLTKHGTTQKITEKEIQKIREQTKK